MTTFTKDNPMIGFHLDLKYIMPNKEYLCGQWLEEIAGLGINVLLMEYEDRFPYQKYPHAVAPGAFTPDELKAFLDKARKLGITPIPLVQTLAHLEFVLSHPSMEHLREQPDIHTHICPSNPEAIQLVHDLIDEVLEYHKEDGYFHLGADEAHYTGTCEKCKPKLEKLGKEGYWADHLTQYVNQVKDAGQRAIVWDDIYWPNPKAVHDCTLPKDTILHCWDYVIRQNIESSDFYTFNPSSAGAEYGDGSKVDGFRTRVAEYRKAGYEILSAPCLNWGVLLPMHDHCIENTAAWATLGREQDGLGMINTAWACFHAPLPTYWTNLAATTAVMSEQTDNWESNFHKDWFGVDVEGLSQAFEDLGEFWEQRVTDLRRPISPIIFGYMDMVLWWPTFDMRSKRAAYPRNKNIVNFSDMYMRKLYVLQSGSEAERVEFKKTAKKLMDQYTRGAAVMSQLASQATKHKKEAALLATFGKLKQHCAEATWYHLTGEGDASEIASNLKAVHEPLATQVAQFVDENYCDFLLRSWWQPTMDSLA